MSTLRKPYPSDVTDEEWAFVAPYLTLMTPAAPQRRHDLREVFNALRWLGRTGSPWRYLPHDLPPWPAVHQQTQRWRAAGCFEAIVDDLRAVLRVAAGRAPADGGHFGRPHAAIDPGERTASGLRRTQAAKGLEAARRC
jgi:transposase